MRYSDDNYARIKSQDVRDYMPALKGRGNKQYTTCPFCSDEKGMQYDKKHNLFHCFKCDKSITGAIGAVMQYKNVDAATAIEMIARDLGIESMEEQRKRSISEHKSRNKKSFCQQQLDASGLTVEDVQAEIEIDGGKMWVSPFRRGGVDRDWNVNTDDDEMLIFYYDLYGKPMHYTRKRGGAKTCQYVRVRWSNPEIHKNKDGKGAKYMSPPGASTELYIPQFIRNKFKNEEHIETLIIQEGEKKAEKACKHGIASVGIQGIWNIGNIESGLVQNIQYLVQQCSIKNVVLLFDSDWDHLGKSKGVGFRADERPKSFAGATLKFKDYILTMHRSGVSVDIWFGHINPNEKDDKGIDDLLCNTLKGKEDELAKDIEDAMHHHQGLGQHVSIHKITAKSDHQIRDYWLLNDPDKFFDKYREELLAVPSFYFGYMSYRVDDGKIVQAGKSSERDFWGLDQDKKNVMFDSWEAIQFINANGFYRIHTADLDVDQFKFVRIDDGVVHFSGPTEIRDFVFHYMIQATKSTDTVVRSAFTSKLGSWLSVDKLERIKEIKDNFDRFEPYVQRLYYVNGQVEITAEDIKHSEKILGQVWADKVKPRKFQRVPIIESINYDPATGRYTVCPTEAGMGCEFLTFLCNASNFWNTPGYEATDADEAEYHQHIVNKLTSIGFLLTDYKFQTELKAVIAMDGHMSEVSISNGRSGKSLIGKALEYMLEQTYIDGRGTKNDDDYLYSDVTTRTRNIFLDDVKVNFDFDRFFGALTGKLNVNPKGKFRFSIPNEKSPKFYITTNHAINVTGDSAKDRIIYMSFSNWYNGDHSPVDDFKHQFFVDWDDEQWNLFDNLMAECVMFYLRSMSEVWYRAGKGAVPPPMRDITARTLRQQMGEAFLQWAEVYFDPSGSHLNNRIIRKEMYDAYNQQFPSARFGVTPSNFRKKVEYYCQFKGYHFNVSKHNKKGVSFRDHLAACPDEVFIGDADKSGSVEYFTVCTPEFAIQQPF